MTDTVPAADTRRFTPNDIAVAVAKRVARIGDFDDNVTRPLARHGIKYVDAGFVLTTEGGQTFHVTVTDAPASFVEPCTITCDCGERTVPWPREQVVVECETCGHKVAVAPIMDNYRSAIAHEHEQAKKVRELRDQRDAALKLCADPLYWAGVPDEFAEAVRNALGGAR